MARLTRRTVYLALAGTEIAGGDIRVIMGEAEELKKLQALAGGKA